LNATTHFAWHSGLYCKVSHSVYAHVHDLWD